MLGINQDESFECADGLRLHHLGGCDPKQLLNQHAALAQLIGWGLGGAFLIARKVGGPGLPRL